MEALGFPACQECSGANLSFACPGTISASPSSAFPLAAKTLAKREGSLCLLQACLRLGHKH